MGMYVHTCVWMDGCLHVCTCVHSGLPCMYVSLQLCTLSLPFELLPTGDGPELRDMVIRAGIIPGLLQLIQSELPVSTDAPLSF